MDDKCLIFSRALHSVGKDIALLPLYSATPVVNVTDLSIDRFKFTCLSVPNVGTGGLFSIFANSHS